MQYAELLGQRTDDVFARPPFNALTFKKTIERDLPEVTVDYSCPKYGIELTSTEDGVVTVVFFSPSYAELHQSDEMPYLLSSRRPEILARLGTPTIRGQPHTLPVLGEYGAWDRFDGRDYCIHVQYQVASDNVSQITLMLPHVAP